MHRPLRRTGIGSRKLEPYTGRAVVLVLIESQGARLAYRRRRSIQQGYDLRERPGKITRSGSTTRQRRVVELDPYRALKRYSGRAARSGIGLRKGSVERIAAHTPGTAVGWVDALECFWCAVHADRQGSPGKAIRPQGSILAVFVVDFLYGIAAGRLSALYEQSLHGFVAHQHPNTVETVVRRVAGNHHRPKSGVAASLIVLAPVYHRKGAVDTLTLPCRATAHSWACIPQIHYLHRQDVAGARKRADNIGRIAQSGCTGHTDIGRKLDIVPVHGLDADRYRTRRKADGRTVDPFFGGIRQQDAAGATMQRRGDIHLYLYVLAIIAPAHPKAAETLRDKDAVFDKAVRRTHHTDLAGLPKGIHQLGLGAQDERRLWQAERRSGFVLHHDGQPAVAEVPTARRRVWQPVGSSGKHTASQGDNPVFSPEFHPDARFHDIATKKLHIVQGGAHQDAGVLSGILKFLHLLIADYPAPVPVHPVVGVNVAVPVAVIATSDKGVEVARGIRAAHAGPGDATIIGNPFVDLGGQHFGVPIERKRVFRRGVAGGGKGEVHLALAFHHGGNPVHDDEMERIFPLVVAAVVGLYDEAMVAYWEAQGHEAAIYGGRAVGELAPGLARYRDTRHQGVYARFDARGDGAQLAVVRNLDTKGSAQPEAVYAQARGAVQDTGRDNHRLGRHGNDRGRSVSPTQRERIEGLPPSRTPVHGINGEQELTPAAEHIFGVLFYLEAVVVFQDFCGVTSSDGIAEVGVFFPVTREAVGEDEVIFLHFEQHFRTAGRAGVVAQHDFRRAYIRFDERADEENFLADHTGIAFAVCADKRAVYFGPNPVRTDGIALEVRDLVIHFDVGPAIAVQRIVACVFETNAPGEVRKRAVERCHPVPALAIVEYFVDIGRKESVSPDQGLREDRLQGGRPYPVGGTTGYWAVAPAYDLRQQRAGAVFCRYFAPAKQGPCPVEQAIGPHARAVHCVPVQRVVIYDYDGCVPKDAIPPSDLFGSEHFAASQRIEHDVDVAATAREQAIGERRT